jgi:hypothetical protein
MIRSGAFPTSSKSGFESFLAGLVLFVSVYFRFGDLPSHMDLRLYDESYYLCQGVFQPIDTWLADYSALYSYWYRLLHLVTGMEAVNLYFLNYGIWVFVLGMVVFQFSRLAGLSFPMALAWALLATSSQIGLPLWPKVGHFAMLGTAFLSWLFLKWSGDKLLRMGLLSFGLLLISWARPEFFVGGLLALGFFLFYLFTNRSPVNWLAFWPVIFLLAVDLYFLNLWGLPIGRSGRGIVAFGQHFVHNWRMMEGADPSGLHRDWVNWREIFTKVFGTDESLIQAFLNQPIPILKHFLWNLGQLVWVPFQYFFETLFPQRFVPFSVPVCVTVVFFGLDAFSGFSVLGRQWSKGLKWLKIQGPDLLPLLLPSVLAGLIFQARAHYLIPLFPWFVFGVAKVLAGFQLHQVPAPIRSIISFSVLSITFFFLPHTSSYFKAGKSPKAKDAAHEHFGIQYSGSFPHLTLVKALSAMDVPSDSRWFDASTGATEFLGTRIQRFGKIGFELDYPQIQNLELFLHKNDIRFILLHPTMDYDHGLRRNVYLNQLRRDPSSLNWEKRKLTGTADSVLIRLQK